MEETLINPETAKLAKNKGCRVKGIIVNDGGIARCTQSILQKWVRETYWIHINITKESIGSDEKVYAYEIEYLPKEFWEAKRHVKHLVYIESFVGGMSSYDGGWDTYEEALEVALQKSLNLIEL